MKEVIPARFNNFDIAYRVCWWDNNDSKGVKMAAFIISQQFAAKMKALDFKFNPSVN